MTVFVVFAKLKLLWLDIFQPSRNLPRKTILGKEQWSESFKKGNGMIGAVIYAKAL